MIYSANGEPEILMDSTYKGVRYLIVNMKSHPCCYVECGQDFIDRHLNREDGSIEDIQVHGGVTFFGSIGDLQGCDGIGGVWFGWGYNHIGDWNIYMSDEWNLMMSHSKLSTDILILECKGAIDQYLKILGRDERVVLDRKKIETAEELVRKTETWQKSEAFRYALMKLKISDEDAYYLAMIKEICTAGLGAEYEDMVHDDDREPR